MPDLPPALEQAFAADAIEVLIAHSRFSLDAEPSPAAGARRIDAC